MPIATVPVLTADEAAAWDKLAREAAAIPSRVLMESAGRAVAHILARDHAAALPKGVLVICGRGNNGGDGWVAARALAALGVSVSAVAIGGEPSADNAANRTLAERHGVRLLGPAEDWGSPGLIVDALLGTGARGKPDKDVASAIERLMRFGVPVVAVDGPSGLDLSTGVVSAPCVRAALTVTFGGFRRGHLLQRTQCGHVVAAEMGFPLADAPWPSLVTDAWVGSVLEPFTADMHKGERGKVLVIGGASGMAGAAMFAARGAHRSGAGLVKLAAAPESVVACQAQYPDILCVSTALAAPLEPELEEAIGWADAIVLGPGLGRAAERPAFIGAVLERTTAPILIDADALVLLRGMGDIQQRLAGRRALLTPHRGEFAVLFPEFSELVRRDPFGAAQSAADRSGQAVLLKGVPTACAAPGVPVLVSASGNPGLATGGTGDVLSGMAATWLARGAKPQIAGAAAAHVHGRAAEDLARHRSVRTIRPDDIMGVLSPLWRELASGTTEIEPPVLARLEPPEIR